MRENQIQYNIRVAMGRRPDVVLFRNEVGQATHNGRTVRYGLCRGSSDLIGFQRVTITPDMVGQELAVFVAIEVKAKNGRVRPEQEQFMDLVKRFGGRAGVARSVEDVDGVLS